MTKKFYKIEEWIPPALAIGGEGYWYHLLGNDRTPFTCRDKLVSETVFGDLMQKGRRVRLVEVSETVLMEFSMELPGHLPGGEKL